MEAATQTLVDKQSYRIGRMSGLATNARITLNSILKAHGKKLPPNVTAQLAELYAEIELIEREGKAK